MAADNPMAAMLNTSNHHVLVLPGGACSGSAVRRHGSALYSRGQLSGRQVVQMASDQNLPTRSSWHREARFFGLQPQPGQATGQGLGSWRPYAVATLTSSEHPEKDLLLMDSFIKERQAPLKGLPWGAMAVKRKPS